MTLADYVNKDLPNSYFSLMYQDGYTPEEILQTAHRQFYDELTYSQEAEDVNITSEVKL